MDNGKPFDNRLMNKICDLFGFKQCNSSMYNAAANGLAEAFNKTLCNLLKKVISKSKRDWNDRMEEALWITDEENARLRLAELEALDKKRLEAQQSLECYQAQLSRVFNKRVRPRSFQVGDQVIAIRRPIITSHKPVGKFTSKWDEPYVFAALQVEMLNSPSLQVEVFKSVGLQVEVSKLKSSSLSVFKLKSSRLPLFKLKSANQRMKDTYNSVKDGNAIWIKSSDHGLSRTLVVQIAISNEVKTFL
ncbi:uncharacterized protein [Nicotiana tomentosiformis]|uniref:uncharacterized protein n=1 Tax=Nicotiana tomentosiformis TaxID=4098 RepID=UPI00388C5271